MCESEMQGIERGARGHHLQRLETLSTKGMNGAQGITMARGVIFALDAGILSKEDFSKRNLDVSEVRDTAERVDFSNVVSAKKHMLPTIPMSVRSDDYASFVTSRQIGLSRAECVAMESVERPLN